MHVLRIPNSLQRPVREWGGRLLLFAAFLPAVLLSLRRMSDTDIWAHLKCGEYFFEKGAILKTHYFNCSWPDFPYLNHEWLFQAIIYKVYNFSGEAGIIGLQMFLIVFSFFLLYKTVGLYTGDRLISAGLIALGVMASQHRFALRPQHFSFVFLLYFLFSLHKYQRGDRRYAWFMPAVMAFWVNIHAESLWGIIVPAVFISMEYIKMRLGNGMSRADMRRIVLIFCLVIAASMLNPFGYKTVFWPLFVMKEQFAGVIEIFPSKEIGFIYFWAYFAIFAASSFANWRRIDKTWLALSAIFACIAWTANRGIPHFVFVSGPLIAANLTDLSERFEGRKKAAALFSLVARVIPALFILWILWFIATHQQFTRKYDGVPYPEGALRFVKANGIKGNVFNNHAWGGYIIWNSYPDLKPYIDGRFFRKKFYDEFNHVMSVSPGWQDILAKYDITIALLPYSASEKGTLNDRLFSLPNWRLVYWDDESLLYLKDTPGDAGVIGRYGNSIINPDRQLYGYGESSPRLIEKADAAARLDLLSAPESWKAQLVAANTAFLKGDYPYAVSRYEALKGKLAGGEAWRLLRLAMGYRRMGDITKAEEYARESVKAAPQSGAAADLLKELRLLRQGKTGAAAGQENQDK